MRYGHISRRQAEGSFDVLDADVTDLQASYALGLDHYGWQGGENEFDIDALLADVDIELTMEQSVAQFRVDRRFTDARRATRTTRRADRSALRSLPTRQLDPSVFAEFEAA